MPRTEGRRNTAGGVRDRRLVLLPIGVLARAAGLWAAGLRAAGSSGWRHTDGVLIHPWDAPLTELDALAFVRRTAFGHLVAPGRRDVPVVVPTQYVVDDGAASVAGGRFPDVLLHLARPNPIWAALDESPTAVLSVAGEWAYVPAAWKAIDDEDPALGIPTTYYAAVQLVATAEILDDDATKLAVLRAQLGALEPGSGVADPSVHERRLAGIRGLRLSVHEVLAKFKYGGNVDEAHRSAVADRLAARGGPGDAAARAHVLRSLEQALE